MTTSRTNHLVWIGAIVSVGALISYFVFFARFPLLRDTPWVNLPAVVLGLGLSIFAVVRRRSIWSIAGLVLSGACVALLFGYVYGLSSQLPDVEGVVSVGDVAPTLELANHDGQLVRLEDFGETQVVLVFYRGFW